MPRFLLFLCCLIASNRAAAAPVRVFAAVSLTNALQEIAAAYADSGGGAVIFNFAASNVLALQIQAGAPADIFIAADDAKMDALEQRGLLLAGTRRTLVSNQLVIVVNAKHPAPVTRPDDLAQAGVGRIALADPDIVPAGIYAKSYLQSRRLWRTVSPKVVPTEDVRATLVAVESGNVDAGIVYRTDAATSTRVRVVYPIPLLEGPRIAYSIAILRGSRDLTAARHFVAQLESSAARVILRAHGFIVD